MFLTKSESKLFNYQTTRGNRTRLINRATFFENNDKYIRMFAIAVDARAESNRYSRSKNEEESWLMRV